jgi:hypothetical protein
MEKRDQRHALKAWQGCETRASMQNDLLAARSA